MEVYQLRLFQQWYVFTLLHTYIVYILYMYKLLCCESPCTQANWEKKALALFTSLETGYTGCHVHVDTKDHFLLWYLDYKATLQATFV